MEKNISLPIFLYLVAFLIFVLSFTVFAFPKIPAFFGGGEPQVQSFIGSSEEIKFLSEFAIKPESTSTDSVQTANLCILYENENSSIVLVTEGENDGLRYRILKLKKELIKGFGSIKGDKDIETQKESCKQLISTLMFNNFKNILFEGK